MKMLLGHEWVDRDDTIDVRDPFDDSIIDTVPAASHADVETAPQLLRAGDRVVVRDAHDVEPTGARRFGELVGGRRRVAAPHRVRVHVDADPSGRLWRGEVRVPGGSRSRRRHRRGRRAGFARSCARPEGRRPYNGAPDADLCRRFLSLLAVPDCCPCRCPRFGWMSRL